MYIFTTATAKVCAMTKKIRGVQGGTSASKTISILLKLTNDAQADASPTLTSVVSESVPHLKRGALRDWKKMMKEHGYWREGRWNATDSIYTFETGSQMEFFSADDASKLRGGRRDRLFMNEGNNIAFEAFEELEVRTREYVYVDWNPTIEFWFHDEVMGMGEGSKGTPRTDAEMIILTYLDNEGCPPEIVASIEQRRNRKGWWQVYGLGQLGEVEGRVYTGWNIVDGVPHEARLVCRGLDYGYTNDPTALYDIYRYNGGWVVDQQLYRKGLSNKKIAEYVLNLEGDVPIVPDSSEPKSNDELIEYGLTVLPTKKKAGSVSAGISFVQGERVSITKRSVQGIKEYRTYLFMQDQHGRITNQPEDGNDHAMDAIRYGMTMTLAPDQPQRVATVTYPGRG